MDHFARKLGDFLGWSPSLRAKVRRFAALGKAAWVIGAHVLCMQGLAAERPALAEPPGSVKILTNYYRFGGTNYWQMRAATQAARPWKGTSPYDAKTDWELHANFRCSRLGAQYKLAAIDLTTKVTVTLPLWSARPPVYPELVQAWGDYFRGLSEHEAGHIQIALAAQAELRRRLQALAVFPSPGQLVAAANKMVNDTTAEFRERDVKYDQETQHGRTQGAILRHRHREPEVLAAALTNGVVPPQAPQFHPNP